MLLLDIAKAPFQLAFLPIKLATIPVRWPIRLALAPVTFPLDVLKNPGRYFWFGLAALMIYLEATRGANILDVLTSASPQTKGTMIR